MASEDRASEAWHALDVAATATRLGTDADRGLTEAEAARRLVASGPNEIEAQPGIPWWRRLARQFQQLVIVILVVAAVIAGLLGEWADTAAILAIVVINGAIGFFQEERAQQALSALRRLAAPQARVVRDGLARVVAAREIVVGDRIELDAGCQVPADARLLTQMPAMVWLYTRRQGFALPFTPAQGRLAPLEPIPFLMVLAHWEISHVVVQPDTAPELAGSVPVFMAAFPGVLVPRAAGVFAIAPGPYEAALRAHDIRARNAVFER
jgi:hypothetical protein